MNALKGRPGDTTERRPYDDNGRFVPIKCELCDAGSLRHMGNGFWSCDGLLDPEDADKELQACPAFHQDGEARVVLEPPRPRGVDLPDGGQCGA